MRSRRRSITRRIIRISGIGWSAAAGEFVAIYQSNIGCVIVTIESFFRRGGRFGRQTVVISVGIVDDDLLGLTIWTASFHVCST